MVKKNKKSSKNEEAVSPVIGVILMVAITVIMAAIVSSWSSSVKAPSTPTSIGLDITRNTDNFSIVITSIDPISAAPLPALDIAYQYWNGSIPGYESRSHSSNDVNVGELIEIDTNNQTAKRVIITATYKDNSKKVLYSQEV